MCYRISISLQIAGSLLLLINTFSTKRKNVLRRFGYNNIIYLDGNTKQIDYDENYFKGLFKEAYITKGAFFFIASGYFLNIFSENNRNQVEAAIYIIIGAVVFMILAYSIASLLVRYLPKVNTRITKEELDKLKIKPALPSISNEEIDAMFHEKKKYNTVHSIK